LFANPGADLFGSDRMLLEAARGIAASGYRVVVAVPETGPLVDELEAAGAEVVHQPTPILRKGSMSVRGVAGLAVQAFRALPAATRILWRARPAVLVVNTVTQPLWLVLGRLVPGVRVACHLHEAEQALSGWLLRVLYLPLFCAHRIIANSHHTLDVLAASVPRLAARTVVVHNAVPGPPAVVPPRPALTGPVQLVYVGRISERKGVLVAIEALGRLREEGLEAHLRIVGSVFAGNASFLDETEAMVARLGLTERVTFVGFQREVWPELERADIVLMPSLLDESFGNVAVEAALAARPAVVSDLAGIREATQASGSVRRVRPGDSDALADAVRELVDDWPAQASGALSAAPIVAERFSHDRYVAGLLDALALPANAVGAVRQG